MGQCESQNDYSNGKSVFEKRKLAKLDDRERNEKEEKLSDKGSGGKGLKARRLHISQGAKDSDRVLANIFRSVCHIEFEISSETKIGHGFLISFWVEQEKFYCLMTNVHFIPEKLFKDNIEIYLSYDKGLKSTKFNLNDGRK